MQYWVYPNAILYVYKLTFTTFNIEIHTKTNWKLKREKTQLYKEQCLFSQQSTLTFTSTRTFTENHSFVLNEFFWSISICYFKYLCAGGVSKGQGRAARRDASKQRAEGTKNRTGRRLRQTAAVHKLAKSDPRLVIFHSSYQEKTAHLSPTRQQRRSVKLVYFNLQRQWGTKS